MKSDFKSHRLSPTARPLRLLVAGINWPPETFIYRLIDGLSREGVLVTVGSPNRPTGNGEVVQWLETPSWDSSPPVKLARLSTSALRAMVNGWQDVRSFAPWVEKNGRFSERLRCWNLLLPYAGRRWDIIYFPWNSASIACLPVFDLGCPMVVSCRGAQVSVAPHNPEHADLRSGLRATFERAAVVHCVSEATLQDAVQLGLDSAKARVIRPAVNPEQFRPAPSRLNKQGTFSVVTVGTLMWRKGHEWALQAIRRVCDAGINVQFEIIGDGPDRQRVLYTIADLGLGGHVRLVGKLSPGQVLQRVQQADAFLLPSLSEGISNAVLEAMACGVPVVTTECGGMREAVTDGVEGFVVPVRDSEAMAGALLRLAGDPGLRQRMGQAGRIRVERDFSLSRQIEQWMELFQSLLGPKSKDKVPGSMSAGQRNLAGATNAN